MRNQLDRWRGWLALAGLLVAVVVLLPPAGSAATHYVFAQAVQFVALGFVAPALIVLGAPWRLISPGPAGRLAMARSDRSARNRPWLVLVCYIALLIVFRLPIVVNALVRHPALTVAEALVLVTAGCVYWLEMVGSPPFAPTATRPVRAALAAVPMWTMWVSSYIMAFSRVTWFPVFAHRAGHGLSIAADQLVAAALIFAISGLCSVPVIYVVLMTWLRDPSYREHELRRLPASGTALGTPRPPRGWRAPLG